MPKRSKFFCIAVEGATCDGRTLDRAALQEMADTYDPKTYTARVNMEHIRGFSADPPFCAYGDVAALKTEEVTLKVGGVDVKKLGLFAEVDALDNLLALQAKGQKLFSSVELNPAFADSGKAYLQGLAVTDNPASLGTEIMTFAAGLGDKSPLAGRKQSPGNFFSAAQPITIEFEADTAGAEDWTTKLKGVLDTFAAKFTAPAQEPPKKEEPKADQAAPFDQAKFATELGTTITAAIGAYAGKADGQISALSAQVVELKQAIETTDGNPARRQLASGDGAGKFRTDC